MYLISQTLSYSCAAVMNSYLGPIFLTRMTPRIRHYPFNSQWRST